MKAVYITIGTNSNQRALTPTLGVLTKPDIVLKGEHDQWKRIAKIQAHTLKHGWHITCQSSAEELLQNPSWNEIRKVEKEFFREDPWNTLYKNRLGAPNHVSALSSSVLSGMIKKGRASMFPI